MTFKNLFDTVVTVEHIQDVPLNNGYLFAKLKLKNGKFRAQTATKHIVNHKVEWHETFEMQCSIRSDNGRLTDKNLTVSVKKEVNGGKDSEKLGHFDINLAERASYNTPCQGRYILKVNKKSKAGNSIVVVTTTMTRVTGDPIFKTAADSQISTLAQDKIVDININMAQDIHDTSSDEERSQVSVSSRRVPSPARSLDCVPITPPPQDDLHDLLYTTQSLDRRDRGKQPSSELIKSLRAKSASGSITTLSLQDTTVPVDVSSVGAVSKQQSRQESDQGGSNEEQIAT